MTSSDSLTMYQDLSAFRLPPNFRGRKGWYVQLWWLVQATLFRCSPQFFYAWRASLLRLFGARVGQKTVIRPTVTVTYPWNVEIGDRAWIGDDVTIYSLGKIIIGNDSVVSQRGYLCGGGHRYDQVDFAIYAKPILIEDQVWVATDVFVAPGVTIHRGAVVGARSVVLQDLPSGMVCVGCPAKPIKPRVQVT